MLAGGVQVVTVTDATNATTICFVTIVEPPPPTCIAPLTYLWDNNEITATATNLTEGLHVVTVGKV